MTRAQSLHLFACVAMSDADAISYAWPPASDSDTDQARYLGGSHAYLYGLTA